MENLLRYIHSLTPFSEESWQTLQPALTEMELQKDEFLLEAGKVCHALYFIDSGFCRAWYNKDGQDINTAFFFENDIATNISSLATGEKSAFSIQAAEQLSVVRFDVKTLREVSAKDPAIDALGRKCLQLIAAKQEKHAAMFKLMTAQERYEYLQQQDGRLLQRVSLTQLSSYLGVARETLSRIRSRK
ncbi:Crp/Fnr family transcriptional regulator [Chitinophaga arvensicola]|nr:Crp/Fnr family transcriptional regulator [Chitinophaga arvensicola]